MITIPEAARRAGRSAETIRRWVRAGKLASQKVGTQHLVDEREVLALAGGRVAEAPVPYAVEPFDEPDFPPELRARIVADPRVLVGKPVVRGTRISVELVLQSLAAGWTVADLLDDYPSLTEPDIRACIAYGAWRVAEERVVPGLFR